MTDVGGKDFRQSDYSWNTGSSKILLSSQISLKSDLGGKHTTTLRYQPHIVLGHSNRRSYGKNSIANVSITHSTGTLVSAKQTLVNLKFQSHIVLGHGQKLLNWANGMQVSLTHSTGTPV